MYGPYSRYPGYPPPRATNSLAVASLVCAFVFAPLGIVFGHMSLSQIKKTGEEGRGLAIAGLVIGYLVVVGTVVVVVVSVVMVVLLARQLEEFDEADDFRGHALDAPTGPPLPPFDPPATLGANCQYPATTEPSSRPVTPPRPGRVSTTPESVPVSVVTIAGTSG